MAEDLVNHPSHYAGQGDIECKDFMKFVVDGYEGYVAACVANIVKYCWRCHGKETIRSLKSARWYFNEARDTLRNLPLHQKMRLSFIGSAHLRTFGSCDSEFYGKVMVQMGNVFDKQEMSYFKNIMDNLVDCGLYRDASFCEKSRYWTNDSFEVVGAMLDAWVEHLGG